MNKIGPGRVYNWDALEAAARALKDQPLGSRAYISADAGSVRIFAAPVTTRSVDVNRTEEREEEVSPVAPYVNPLSFKTY
jgi:hypothetical protein